MRSRLLTGAVLALIAFPAAASAAHFDQAPPVYNQTGTPFNVVPHGDGLSVSSGVAYKLSNETAWHRCLALTPTVTLNLPAGDYSIEIADDISRAWFDQNLPQDPTPECQETTAPKNRPVTVAWFYVRNPPPVDPKPLVDTCGPELARVAKLHRAAENGQASYERRHTASRRRAWRKAAAKYRTARRTFDKHC